MPDERPLGTFSDELDRMYAQIVQRLDAGDQRAGDRQSQIVQRLDRTDLRIDSLTAQVTATNGSVRDLQKWRSYMEGLKAGAGGSWHLLIGASGLIVGAAGVGVAAMTLILHMPH